MKYNININQLVLSETKLDLSECAILDWLIYFCNSKNQKIDSRRKNGYTQIEYNLLIEELPLLRVKSKGSITAKIANLESEGFIEVNRSTHQSNYVKLTDKVDELFSKLNSSVQNIEQIDTKAVQNTEPIIILNNHYTKSLDTCISKNPEYLLNIPEHDIDTFRKKYKATKSEIIIKGEALHNWAGSVGKKYKDYRLFLMNALLRDYGLRELDTPGVRL